MQIDSTFPNSNTTPPPGYAVYRAKPWPIPELDLSYETFDVSSFQVTPLWVDETRQFSAGSAGNWSLLTDVRDKLIALQPKDGIDIHIKMNWLIHSGNGVACMWTGDKKIEWKDTTDYRAGCQLWGNQLFAATVETSSVKTKIG